MRMIVVAGAAALTLMAAGDAGGTMPSGRATRGPVKGGPPVVNIQDTDTEININQIAMFVTNLGSFAFDLGTGNSGLEFPRNTGRTAVFAAGLWVGAKVDTGATPGTEPKDIRVALAEYAQEYVPGPMEGGTFVPDSPSYKVFKVSRADTVGYGEWLSVAVPQGAPFIVVGSDTLPGIIGDQTLWSVYNDADPEAHGLVVPSDPMGIEVQQTTFAFDRQGALGNTVFMMFRIENKGSSRLDSTFVSIWSDPDLGGFTDDLVAIDRPRSLGYCYNATNNDEIYGTRPPAVGFDYFQGPLADDGVTRLPVTAFVKYINGTDPSSREQVYNYMRGLEASGLPIINPVTGLPTRFMHDGDPVTDTGWIDTNPADRRLFMTSGPFTMDPGDVQEIVCAVVIGVGRDRLSSITAMRIFDDVAQDAFDRGFDLPSPPPQPVVTAQELDRTIVLTWGRESEDPDPVFNYEFEGYNVYQGETVAGPWIQIAKFDVVNNVTVISDSVFDAASGTFVFVPVQVGTDSGLEHELTITNDAVRGGQLNNGTQYYFAVTAYNYNPNPRPSDPVTLENSQQAITVIPQRPVLGTDLSTAAAGDITQVPPPSGTPTSDVVEVIVIDPTRVTGHDYEVFYTPAEPGDEYQGEPVSILWNLRDLTTGQVVLSGVKNRTGNDDYDIVDGIMVKVIGSNVGDTLQDVIWVQGPDPTGAREMVGVDWGGDFFDRGADFAKGFADLDPPVVFDSALDPVANADQFSTVEIRMGSRTDPSIGHSNAYRYVRDEIDGSVTPPPGGRKYEYGGFVDVPFQVWDTLGDLDPGNDIQVDALYVERRLTAADGTILDPSLQPATFDSTWSPDRTAQGGREYIFVARTTYSDTPKAQYEVNDPFHALSAASPLAPLMYVVWPRRNTGNANQYDVDDQFKFIWAQPATVDDRFTFSTTAPVRDDATLAASQLSTIRVVPNPYYAHSAYETNQFSRVMRFMNLPARCTIRIFSLSGHLVQTLEKNDPTTSILNWNLKTANDLPVASGVYLYQVEAPGIGDTTGRLVVFTEKERLNNF